MIAYFPQLYEDELFYSVIARFTEHEGFVASSYAANELFVHPRHRIEKEFVKNLKQEVLDVITKQISMEEIIEKHTMFPYYARFIKPERRETVRNALYSGRGDFTKLCGIPQNKTGRKRYIRLCPLCTNEDRRLYGEAYIHRSHQMWNIQICAKHQCKLLESQISLDSFSTAVAVSAEKMIEDGLDIDSVEMNENQIEQRYTTIMNDVLCSNIYMNEELSDRLRKLMTGTDYISHRGEHFYYTKLYQDMKQFYDTTHILNNIEVGHIQRLLSGNRIVFDEIIAVMLFMNWTGYDLIRTIDIDSFDSKVQLLKQNGMGVNEIARSLCVSMSVVRWSLTTEKEKLI